MISSLFLICFILSIFSSLFSFFLTRKIIALENEINSLYSELFYHIEGGE